LEAVDGFAQLDRLGASLEQGIRDLLRKRSLGWSFYRIGSMFCLFFTDRAVRNLDDAKHADLEAFRIFFHKLLAAGVYLPPSQFETCFLSLAHGEREIGQTLDAFDKALP
jgi:glutamate-1-semialdehyde 2,1-aminomutase